MHYLITGHTGFKGAWLVMLLKELGHEVSGIALDPLPNSLFISAGIAQELKHDLRLDIRDRAELLEAFELIRPDVVFHLAAQPLVLESYRDPIGTFETNVIGTLNVLAATSECSSVQAQVIVTTDKVYENVGKKNGYIETDPLGGKADPYSASKAMADILTQAWSHSFSRVPTAIARAGNVIGGGDISQNRLLPDIWSAAQSGQNIKLRYPNSVRPWQHVLDCVAGYIKLAEYLLIKKPVEPSEWNFGPGPESFLENSQIAMDAFRYLDLKLGWIQDGEPDWNEAHLLALNSTKARDLLEWTNKLPYPACLEWTLDWQMAATSLPDLKQLCVEQIEKYLSIA